MNTCKHCNSRLIIKKTHSRPSQPRQNYYYTSYYFCPACRRIYHDEKFKVKNMHTEFDFNTTIVDKKSIGASAEIDIWTDGACTNNGNARAKAAWAFVSGEHEESGLIEGKQTNNIAEAMGIYHALLWASKQGYKRIRIYSDSQITINNLQKSPENIKANQNIFKMIFALIKEKQLYVFFSKVIGHSGDINNDRVDKLANSLASVS